MSKRKVVELDGLEVEVYRGEDGKLVVALTGPGDEDLTDEESPDIRIWLNEALIYAHGDVGDDLSCTGISHPESADPVDGPWARCRHSMFFSGAGACPQCGGGAE